MKNTAAAPTTTTTFARKSLDEWTGYTVSPDGLGHAPRLTTVKRWVVQCPCGYRSPSLNYKDDAWMSLRNHQADVLSQIKG